ncbi:MAG: STAS domain-containing protein [Candidatus Sumerlaeota bacterium]|nr:STAS domain-containing protein [Candidatus Sumerlaeota bacterium]
MSVRIEKKGDIFILRPNERALTFENHQDLREAFQSIAAQPFSAIVLDLGLVEFLDSVGLGAIVAGRLNLKDKGEIHLCALAPTVESTIHFARLDLIFKVYDSRDSALAAIGPQNETCEVVGVG